MDKMVSQLDRILRGREELLVNYNGLTIELAEKDSVELYWNLQGPVSGEENFSMYLNLGLPGISEFIREFSLSSLEDVMSLNPSRLWERFHAGQGSISCLGNWSTDFIQFKYQGDRILARYKNNPAFDVTTEISNVQSYANFAKKLFQENGLATE